MYLRSLRKSTQIAAFAIAAIAMIGSSSLPASAAESSVDDLPEYPTLQAMLNPDGSAQPTTFSVEAGQYRGPQGERITVAASGTWTCILTVDTPHWSSGAASVIAKPRVACRGANPSSIPIRVSGLLGKTSVNSISSLQIVASSEYVQNVQVTSSTTFGPKQTWYVPAQGSGVHISRGAYFRGSASAASSAPLLPFNIPSAASSFLYVP